MGSFGGKREGGCCMAMNSQKAAHAAIGNRQSAIGNRQSAIGKIM
jgi:hypothetical protein